MKAHVVVAQRLVVARGAATQPRRSGALTACFTLCAVTWSVQRVEEGGKRAHERRPPSRLALVAILGSPLDKQANDDVLSRRRRHRQCAIHHAKVEVEGGHGDGGQQCLAVAAQ